jgi:hypothetical protein
MKTNLEVYKQDIQNLINNGEELLSLLKHDDDLKIFRKDYEVWYSESLALIKAVLSNRMGDFEKYYYQKGEDCLKKSITYTPPRQKGLESKLTSVYNSIPAEQVDYARVLFENQLGIVKVAAKRFESSLFDIRQLVQADLFDSELAATKELNKKGFTRGAGAVAGVVLEKHLSQICASHNIPITKKTPTINDFNQLLKDANVIDIPTWRFIQHLGDLRNLCDHNKEREPTEAEIEELSNGVDKITKTIF